ncbi:MAG: BCCT family transporter, partial [Pseudomonadota bacterium]
MSVQPALTELPIQTASSGFYRGFSQKVTITSKLLILGLVIWAIAFPEQSGAVLNGINKFILS